MKTIQELICKILFPKFILLEAKHVHHITTTCLTVTPQQYEQKPDEYLEAAYMAFGSKLGHNDLIQCNITKKANKLNISCATTIYNKGYLDAKKKSN